MAVYVVAQGRITDRKVLDEYVDKAIPTLDAHGARIVAFDETPQVVEGTTETWPPGCTCSGPLPLAANFKWAVRDHALSGWLEGTGSRWASRCLARSRRRRGKSSLSP